MEYHENKNWAIQVLVIQLLHEISFIKLATVYIRHRSLLESYEYGGRLFVLVDHLYNKKALKIN
jgi:hypothetical protein